MRHYENKGSIVLPAIIIIATAAALPARAAPRSGSVPASEQSASAARAHQGPPVPTFTDVTPAAAPNLYDSALQWGDFDGDGDLDFILTGRLGSGPFVYDCHIYRNTGAGFAAANAFAGLVGASVAWGDYDNDGDLDLLFVGPSASDDIATVYRSSGGSTPVFTDIGAALLSLYNGSGEWGDCDNDGDLDILLNGNCAVASAPGCPAGGRGTRVYLNSGGANPTFSELAGALSNDFEGASAWGDYDNDGDLDILISGFISGIGARTRIYRNDGLPGPVFTEVPLGLPNNGSGACVAWGDYDNDGDLDILLTGSVAAIYRNSGGPSPTFTNIGAGLPLVINGAFSAAWGDCNNDGYLDIALSGNEAGVVAATRIYVSSGGINPTFSDIGATLAAINSGALAWGDYDNDGDLDLLLSGNGHTTMVSPTTRLYRNDLASPANTPPSAPSGLLVGVQTAAGGIKCTFQWNAAADAQTPAPGLTYNLRVGKTPGGAEVMSPMSANNGYRRIPALGNTNHVLSHSMTLANGTYYWTVQAIDAGFAGSPFAAEQTLVINGQTDVREFELGFGLLAAVPNPFQRSAAVDFELSRSEPIRLEVIDIHGRMVRTLVTGVHAAGRHQVTWDGTNNQGKRVPAGVYVYRMRSRSFESCRRTVFVP